ncbi:MAG: hypothetical protein FJX29_09430 [Alphaproteobacteria bacterium]|nr:hypothetical protein [Alphaproteobacteria bacterium]
MAMARLTSTSILALAFSAAFAASASAQTAPSAPPSVTQDAPAGRYSMTPAPNGFLRLDTRTGAVALCTVKNNAVTCAASADERGALEEEIERLARRNAELERRLAALGDQSPSARLRNALPTEQEMNKALGFAEQFMRRMMRIMREEAPKGGSL